MDMNIPKDIKKIMQCFRIVKEQKSKDNVIHKIVFYHPLNRGTFEACSFMRNYRKVFDICFSVMAGCSMGCKICATSYSKSPYERMLDFTEMLAQIYFAIQYRINDFEKDSKITITFMGNGEPFLNLVNVMKTIEYIRAFPPRPIRGYNLSTVGVHVEKISDLAAFTNAVKEKIKLQFSLISLDPHVRQRLLPCAEPLERALLYLDNYAETTGIPVKYNVPLIEGVNNTKQHLEFMADFILQKPCFRVLKISHYNTFLGSPYVGCSKEEMYRVYEYFTSRGIQPKIFFGDHHPGIYATCGLMRIASEEDVQNVV